MSCYYSVLVITVVIINGLHCTILSSSHKILLKSSVNKNNSNTTFCPEFVVFLKPFSVNCD